MGFGKSLFDFVGYMSFFNPIGTGRVSDSLEQQDVFRRMCRMIRPEDESFSSDEFDDL